MLAGVDSMSGRMNAALCLALTWAVPAVAQSSDAARFWGQWRGPDATGVAQYGNPPLEWSETQNIRWKGGDSRSGIGVADRLG